MLQINKLLSNKTPKFYKNNWGLCIVNFDLFYPLFRENL